MLLVCHHDRLVNHDFNCQCHFLKVVGAVGLEPTTTGYMIPKRDIAVNFYI